MQVFIRAIHKTIAIEVDPNDTIDIIKSDIKKREYIDTSHQHLYFENKELEDDRSLSSYHIGDKSTIELQICLVGGGVKVRYPPHLKELAESYNCKKLICRKCYARLHPKATNCRKKKCGHCNDLRPKKKLVKLYFPS